MTRRACPPGAKGAGTALRALLLAGSTAGYCLPRHKPHFEPPSLELIGTLRRDVASNICPLRVSPSRLAVALAGALAADPVLPANSDAETDLHTHLIAEGKANAGSGGVPPRVQNANLTAGATQVAVGPGTYCSLTHKDANYIQRRKRGF